MSLRGKSQATWLSGYRIMWIMVMFDLPTDTSEQRKRATKFREFLLDEGFERSQFSVYARFVNGREGFNARVRRIEDALPLDGEVQILQFTDKQYELVLRYSNRGRRPQAKNPSQLALF